MMFSTGGWIGVPGLGDPVADVQGKAAIGLWRHGNGGQRVYRKAEQVAAKRQRILGGQVIIGASATAPRQRVRGRLAWQQVIAVMRLVIAGPDSAGRPPARACSPKLGCRRPGVRRVSTAISCENSSPRIIWERLIFKFLSDKLASFTGSLKPLRAGNASGTVSL
jgi:hypothetical protein